jgi:hypothetical protein
MPLKTFKYIDSRQKLISLYENHVYTGITKESNLIYTVYFYFKFLIPVQLNPHQCQISSLKVFHKTVIKYVIVHKDSTWV